MFFSSSDAVAYPSRSAGRQTGHPWPDRREVTSCHLPCGPDRFSCRAFSRLPEENIRLPAFCFFRKQKSKHKVAGG
jgi:hypothetical protein